MATDRTDPAAPPAAPTTNGYHPPAPDFAAQRELYAAQCAKIRHWCRDLLDAPTAATALPEEAIRELRDTPPGMELDDIFALFYRQREADLRFPDEDPNSPDPEVRRLSAERVRLRTQLFALMDAESPYRPMTELELRDMLEAPRSDQSIEDILAELERELAEPS